jgi:hypothetical protein
VGGELKMGGTLNIPKIDGSKREHDLKIIEHGVNKVLKVYDCTLNKKKSELNLFERGVSV